MVTDAAVDTRQMPVTSHAILERLQTHPAEMRLARAADHVVAAGPLLDWRGTFRAVLDVVHFFHLEEFPVLLALLVRLVSRQAAGDAVVADAAAFGARQGQTGFAYDLARVARDAVDGRTVRGRTVGHLVWATADVTFQGRRQKGLELFMGQDRSKGVEIDRLATVTLGAVADDLDLAAVGFFALGLETIPAVFVTTGELDGVFDIGETGGTLLIVVVRSI